MLIRLEAKNSSRRLGFSLLEVLIALALVSISLGVILEGMVKETTYVSRIEPRYRALLTASAALERTMDERRSADETNQFGGIAYQVTVRSVPADPRIDSIKVIVGTSPSTGALITAYRLRSETDESAGDSQ